MTHWNQSELRSFIHAHFQPNASGANPSWVNSVALQIDAQGVLNVAFPHAYFQEWFTQYLQGEFESFILHNVPGITGFLYQDKPFAREKGEPFFPPFQGDERHTFTRFLHNSGNREQIRTARALSAHLQWPATVLLICGPPGSGKTSCLFSMANALLNMPAADPVLALNCDDLQSLAHLSGREQERARKEIHRARAFLLDDVHLSARSTALQEELVLLFDALEEAKTPMVFTRRENMAENNGLDPRLHSRLAGGIILHLNRPDLDIRIQFAQQENDRYRLGLTDDEQLTLARQCTDFQTLNQALCRLAAQNERRSPGRGRRTVRDLIPRAAPQGPTPMPKEDIISLVAGHFSLAPGDLLSSSRKKNVVLARQIAIYICRETHNLSFTRLGTLFGNRNHSSIIYAYKRVQSLQKERPEVKSRIQNLIKQCVHK
jgi:chromosomal replication initiator protein